MSKHRISRREFLRLASVGAAGAALAACQPAPTPAPAATVAPEPTKPVPPTAKPQVTISYWHIWGGARTAQLDEVLKNFMAENPDIKVEPLLLPNPGYSDKILTGLAANPPDLTMIYTDEFAPSARRGALLGVDSMMKADNITADLWYPGVYNMSTWQGKTYGLPFVGNFLQMIYYAKDDFKGAGRDPEKGPQTWADLLEVSKSMTKINNGKAERLGYAPQGEGEWIQAAYRNNATFLGDGTPEKVKLDAPESIEALEYAVNLYKNCGGWDVVGAAADVWKNTQITNPLIAGVASSLQSGVFTVNLINTSKPDLKYGISKIPKGPKGDFLDIITASWSNAIPAKAKYPEQAWRLAKYMSAGDGHLKFMVDMQARPAMVKKYNVAPYDAAARKGNPYWDVVLEILNGKQATYPVSDQLIATGKVIKEAFESVMLNQRKPDEGAKWAQAEVVKLFSAK